MRNHSASAHTITTRSGDTYSFQERTMQALLPRDGDATNIFLGA